MATDGVWDNLFDEDIIDKCLNPIVSKFKRIKM